MIARNSLIAGLFLLSAIPALAQPDDLTAGAYVGLRGSYAFSGNATATYAPTAPPTALRASYASGGGGSLYLGTRLPLNLRLELEALYRWQPVSKASINGGDLAASGRTKLAAPMLNLFWDIPVPLDMQVQPFVGMGVGAAYAETDVNGGGNSYIHQNRWDLAYSFMGGLAMPLDYGTRLTAMYRWIKTPDAGHKCALSGSLQSVCLDNSVTSQAVDLGLEMDL
ncbi:MAG TPA: outer membrane beta-barrel protein [Rhizomicrobium sp.]